MTLQVWASRYLHMNTNEPLIGSLWNSYNSTDSQSSVRISIEMKSVTSDSLCQHLSSNNTHEWKLSGQTPNTCLEWHISIIYERSMFTTTDKCGVSRKKSLLTKAALFDKKNSKTFKIMNYFCHLNNCFLFEYVLNIIYSMWCKAEFSDSLLQSSLSHDLQKSL